MLYILHLKHGKDVLMVIMRSRAHAGNMMLFDKDGIIKRYESPEHILAEFFELRMDYYSRRRLMLIQVPPTLCCTCRQL